MPKLKKIKVDSREIKNCYGGFDTFHFVGHRWLQDIDLRNIGTSVEVYYNPTNGEIKLFVTP
jgi:hypothetical protein